VRFLWVPHPDLLGAHPLSFFCAEPFLFNPVSGILEHGS
jgi:hypothetical protein